MSNEPPLQPTPKAHTPSLVIGSADCERSRLLARGTAAAEDPQRRVYKGPPVPNGIDEEAANGESVNARLMAMLQNHGGI